METFGNQAEDQVDFIPELKSSSASPEKATKANRYAVQDSEDEEQVAHDDISLELNQINEKKKDPIDPADEVWGIESDEPIAEENKKDMPRLSNLRKGMDLPERGIRSLMNKVPLVDDSSWYQNSIPLKKKLENAIDNHI